MYVLAAAEFLNPSNLIGFNNKFEIHLPLVHAKVKYRTSVKKKKNIA